MSQKPSILPGFAMALKIGGILLALTGWLTTPRQSFLGIGLIFFLLGYLVSLLHWIFVRQEPLLAVDSPVLRLRWKAGFIALFLCGIALSAISQPIEAGVDWWARNENVSSDAVLAVKVLALLILGPLGLAALTEPQFFSRLGAFWLRGFRWGLVALLVLLPGLLLALASGQITRLGLVEAGSRLESWLELLVLGLSILLAPLWVLPLFRRLSAFPLSRELVEPFLHQRPEVTPDEAP